MRRVLGVCGCLAFAHGAVGQETARPDGIQVGVFSLRPAISLEQRYDSNIFEESSSETDSFITSVAPRFSAETTWSRHKLEFDIGGKGEFFLNSPDDDTQTFDATFGGIVDVTRRLRFRARAGYQRNAEQRGSDEVDFPVGGPIKEDQFHGEARVQYLPGDFRIEPFAIVRRRDFLDRSGVDQDDRDRLVLIGGVEVGYRLLSGVEAFVRGSYVDIDFDDSVDSDGVDRDSRGYEAFGGIRLRLSRLLVGSFGAGVGFAEFDDPTLDNTTDITARANLDWRPTRRIQVGFNARRAIEQTNVAGAADKIVTDLGVSGRYEILRNLSGSLSAGLRRSTFNGTPRRDTGYFGQAALDWDVTRRTSFRVAYRYFTEDSTLASQDFDKHEVSLSVRYGF